MSQVNTEILTIEKVINDNYLFAIPSYQRPYVWGNTEISKLFEDIRLAVEEKNEQDYFIGTTLSSLNDDRYELVDGQQRTTTLILFAIALKELSIAHAITNLLIAHKPRLHFPIRDNVNELLAYRSGIEQPSLIHQEDAYSEGIKNGIETCKGLIQNLEESELEVFLGYLYTKVCWVNNVLPFGADLNKIFRTANFSGIQLEQHEILKARLLAKVNCSESKRVFAAIWESCQKMDEYFVKNVRDVFIKPSLPSKVEEYSKYNSEFFKLENNENIGRDDVKANDNNRLLFIIQQTPKDIVVKNSSDNEKTKKEDFDEKDTEQSNNSSIVSFSQLLLHAYRIFLQGNGQKDIRFLNEEKLNEVFKDLAKPSELDKSAESSDEVMRFIKLLWQVRYYFDLFVVKRIKDNNPKSEYHDVLMIKKQKFNDKGYFETTIVTDATALTQLQSMLLYTMDRKAQYWLTPFLAYLIQNEKGNPYDERNLPDENVLRALENIDNKLSEQRLDNLQKQSLLELSFECLGQNIVLNNQRTEEIEKVLNKSSGTSFKHYWFYKLEYLLWKKMHSDKDKAYENDEKFKNYRITSKNSVEHVFPQNEEYGHKINQSDVDIDMFGNLVLLSVSENSSYSNQDVGKKMIDFEKKSIYDSLKLKAIYDTFTNHKQEWNGECIKDHQQKMIQIIKNHYSS